MPGLIHGQYRLWPGTSQELVIVNTVPSSGEIALLQLALANVTSSLPDGNFYLGLCATDPTETTTLAELAATEPSGTGGYARLPLPRSVVGWPSIQSYTTLGRAISAVATFTATADFDKVCNRLFLCGAASGTTGTVFSISGKSITPITVLAGTSLPVTYEIFLD